MSQETTLIEAGIDHDLYEETAAGVFEPVEILFFDSWLGELDRFCDVLRETSDE